MSALSHDSVTQAAKRAARERYPRLAKAADYIATLEAAKIDLSSTVASPVGWLIRHREFQVPGYGLDRRGFIAGPPRVGALDDRTFDQFDCYAALATGVALQDARDLFGASWVCGRYDHGPEGDARGVLPDKERFAIRVANFFAELERLERWRIEAAASVATT